MLRMSALHLSFLLMAACESFAGAPNADGDAATDAGASDAAAPDARASSDGGPVARACPDPATFRSRQAFAPPTLRPIASIALTDDEADAFVGLIEGDSESGFQTRTLHFTGARGARYVERTDANAATALLVNAESLSVSRDGLTAVFNQGGTVTAASRTSRSVPFTALRSVAGPGAYGPKLSDAGIFFITAKGTEGMRVYRGAGITGGWDAPVMLAGLGDPSAYGISLGANQALMLDAPLPTRDDEVLYFRVRTLTRPSTFGEARLFVAVRGSDGTFGAPRAVALPTSARDIEPQWVSPDGCRLLVAEPGPTTDGGAPTRTFFFASQDP